MAAIDFPTSPTEAQQYTINNKTWKWVGSLTSWVSDTVVGQSVFEIPFVINGGGSVITAGVKGYMIIPFLCTIAQVTTLADVSGSVVIDIWKDTYTNYPPIVGDSICAAAKPTLSGAIKSQDTTLTGWTKVINAGDTLGYNVDSATTVTLVTVSLKVTRT
jgi:hypothetical protein